MFSTPTSSHLAVFTRSQMQLAGCTCFPTAGLTLSWLGYLCCGCFRLFEVLDGFVYRSPSPLTSPLPLPTLPPPPTAAPPTHRPIFPPPLPSPHLSTPVSCTTLSFVFLRRVEALKGEKEEKGGGLTEASDEREKGVCGRGGRSEVRGVNGTGGTGARGGSVCEMGA